MRMWGISVGVREMRGYTENAENLCGDAGNQGGNLGIAVEMAQTSNANDKLKEWREVKIIEKEHICKNLVSHI